MLLAIDIGNTAVKVQTNTGGSIISLEKIRAKGDAEFVFAPYTKKPVALIGASVVPDVQEMVDRAYEKVFEKKGVWIDGESAIGLPILYKTPSKLGADRIANALAVSTLYQLPAAVVDFGTATKIDVINAAGVYLGGAIMPGVRMGLDALSGGTAKLPDLKPEWPKFDIGQDTRESILTGTVLGHAYAVAGLIQDYETILGAKLTVVLTGGESALFLGRESSPLKQFHPLNQRNLTLVGLFEAAKRLGIAQLT